MSIKDEIISLRNELIEHNRNYYILDEPTISDFEYDRMLHKLIDLENAHPEFITPDSPTQRVGGKASSAFEPVNHEVPLESLTDVFSFEELTAFSQRMEQSLDVPEYVVEPKIDGLSVALRYENGVFVQGATRGDGVTGEDITDNLRTIKDIPMTIKDAPSHLVVRGEVYMPKKVFNELNVQREIEGLSLFANPRNAAAGSMRQLDPKVAASRKLSIIIFNIQAVSDVQFSNHSETIDFIKKLGFPAVDYRKFTSISDCCDRISEIGENRDSFEYDIDGAVIKINSLSDRVALGSTSKAPKWAVAYKYPPEKKETTLVDIVVQVGRTGVLTPKAVVKPVRLAGTTVTNATLHNQDFITEKDIRIGDTVLIQKAGEIIPEVLSVNFSKRPEGTVPYFLPTSCPECGSPVTRDEGGAAVRCRGAECPAQLLRNIVHFGSKNAMDIDGLGISICKALVDSGFIKSPGDLYYLDAQSVSTLERMGKKSSENLIAAINKSKENDLSRLLFSFGILQVGQSAAKSLAGKYNNLDEIASATVEELTEIDDIGEITAKNIVEWFSLPQSQHLIKLLKDAGVNMESVKEETDTKFAGMTFVLTGTLVKYTRDIASGIIERLGGKVSSSVSKKTSVVLAGENAGSKLTKAETLGIKIISEDEFEEMIK